MQSTDTESRWLLLPLALFLLILPFPHTVSPRLAALFVSFVMALVLWRRLAPPPIPCKLPAIFLLLIAMLSLLVAADPSYSIGEIKNEIGYSAVTFVAFYALCRRQESLRPLLLSVAIGFAVLTAWALWERFRVGKWLVEGYVIGEASYATYIVTVAPLLLLGKHVLGERKTLWSAVAIALTILGTVCTYLTLQRTTLPVLLAQLVLALVLLKGRALVEIRWRSVAAMLAIAVALTIVGLQAISHARFKVDTVAASASDIRVKKFQLVVERILAEPLTGYGYGRRAMAKSHADLSKEEPMFWHAHNVFLNYGLSLGIPGIVALLALFGCLLAKFWQLYRNADPFVATLGITGILIIVGVVLRNQTNDLFVRDLALLFWALCGILLGIGNRRLAAQRA